MNENKVLWFRSQADPSADAGISERLSPIAVGLTGPAASDVTKIKILA